MGMSHMLLTTLELTAATAQLEGADLRYSSVPAGYPLPNAFDFSARIRRPLFQYAYQCAESGRFWTAFPHAGDGKKTSQGITRSETMPCPAEKPFNGFLATR